MFPLTRLPLWVPIFDPRPNECSVFSLICFNGCFTVGHSFSFFLGAKTQQRKQGGLHKSVHARMTPKKKTSNWWFPLFGNPLKPVQMTPRETIHPIWLPLFGKNRVRFIPNKRNGHSLLGTDRKMVKHPKGNQQEHPVLASFSVLLFFHSWSWFP